MHWESHEDEFLYMLEGELTVIEDGAETVIGARRRLRLESRRPASAHR